MTPGPTPPRLAARLLAAVLRDAATRNGVLGDLHEEFLDRVGRVGRARAAWWYWTAALAVAGPFVVRPRPTAGANTHGRERMEGWTQDVRYALRRMVRAPGFSTTVMLTAAVAVAANASIFGAVRPVLAPRLPFPDAERVLRIWETSALEGWERVNVSWQNARDWRTRSRTLDALAVYTQREGDVLTPGGAERVGLALVEPDFFRVLGVDPVFGRTLLPDETDRGPSDVVVLDHGFWSRAFGSDPAIVGQRITLSDRPVTVVGVMPQGFDYPSPQIDAWMPFGMTPDEGGDRGAHWVAAIARMNPGRTLDDVRSDLHRVGRQLQAEYPETVKDHLPLPEPLAVVAVRRARSGVLMLWSGVALLLLIACANVATLLLAQGERRSSEMGLRTSLGAGRSRLVRQLLLENLVLVGAGGAVGLLLTPAAVGAVAALVDARLDHGVRVGVDGAVLAYGLAVTLVAGVVAGLYPAFHGPGAAASALRGASGARGGDSTAGRFLVSLQMALSVVIVIGAGLLGRSVVALHSVDPGYDAGRALTFRVAPPWSLQRAEAVALLEELRSRLAGLPGVRSVGAVNRLPLGGRQWVAEWFDREGPEGVGVMGVTRPVLPGYLETLGLEVVQGRSLQAADAAGSEPVAVVSEAFARAAWPGRPALGQSINLAPDHQEAPWYRVVGVVSDVEEEGLGAGPGATVYMTVGQAVFGHFGNWGTDFLIRAEGDAAALAPGVRQAVRDVAPTLPVVDVATLEERVRAQSGDVRALALLMSLFAGTALFLSALGVYGTLAYGVARRRGEIGVRLALGAHRGIVVRRVVGQGIALAGVGLAGGLLLAVCGATLVDRRLLFHVEPLDPLTYGASAMILLAVAVAAAGVPAWSAARVDPREALRDG